MAQSRLDPNNPRHRRAEERLRNNIMIWLGTVRPDGRPHLVPVWFLWDGEIMLIFSKPDQKIRNIQGNPQVALALDDTKGGGDVIVIEGQAELLDPGEVSTALPAYVEKYGEKISSLGWTPESMSAEYSVAVRITPARFVRP